MPGVKRAGEADEIRITKRTKVSGAVKNYVEARFDANQEDKRSLFYLQDTFASVGNAWIELLLNGPPQGTQAGNRTGNRIRLRSIELKGFLVQGSNELVTDDAWNEFRMVLGLYSGASNVPLADAAVPLGGALDPAVMPARARLLRKYVDKWIPMNVTSTEQGAGDGYTPSVQVVSYKKSFGKRGIVITFGDDTTTYIDKRLILSMTSDSAAVTNPGFTHGYVLVKYEDA